MRKSAIIVITGETHYILLPVTFRPARYCGDLSDAKTHGRECKLLILVTECKLNEVLTFL